jgi:hypothetical protein
MPKKSGEIYEDLQEKIIKLVVENEALNRELIKSWRDVIQLAGTNERLFNENQRLIQLYRPSEENDLIAA